MAPRTDEGPGDGAYAVAGHEDPWLHMRGAFDRPDGWDQLLLGVSPDKRFLFSAPRTHCLVLGPPQCFKTAGVLVSAVLHANGPVVVTSTKDDVYRATAIARSRVGRLWQFAPGGLRPEEVLPGAIPLRWSPIEPSRDWGQAQILAKAIADTAEVTGGSSENAAFFRKTAGSLIACVLHAAALASKPMEFVLEAVGEGGSTLDDCERILREAGGYSTIAADSLNQFRRLEGRTRGNVFITASTAFDAYRLPGALESTRDPNFDVEAFVAGDHSVANPGLFDSYHWNQINSRSGAVETMLPHAWFDTVYITSGSQAQALVAPLVVGLLSRIREARYQQTRADQQQMRSRPPTLFALDEIANIAPLQELPGILSEGSSQGLLTMAVMQDLSQAKARWPNYYEGFLTMFREVVMFPGIANAETLERLSMLSGEVWEETVSDVFNYARRRRDDTQGNTYAEQRRVKYSPAELFMGAEQDRDPRELDPRRMLVKQSGGLISWAYATPYFFSPPVAEGLMGCADHIIDRTNPDDWKRWLPLPIMQPNAMVNPENATRWWHSILQDLDKEQF